MDSNDVNDRTLQKCVLVTNAESVQLSFCIVSLVKTVIKIVITLQWGIIAS